MTIVLTGGMGFIGSNIAHALHQRGVDLVVVDHLTQGDKFINAAGIPLLDYCDKNDFLEKFSRGHWGQVEAVLHQGACSATVERNGRYMLENNYHYSWQLLQACQTQRIPFIYASSAATYGLAEVCTESDDTDSAHQPLNVYGYSKWLFDQAVRRYWAGHPSATPIVGLRYFNVYGAREQHKGRMASVAYHLYQQMRRGEAMKLFEGWNGYNAGEQKRDFIHVDDVVAINLFFLDSILGDLKNRARQGIFNVGSGVATPFNAIPTALFALAQAASANSPFTLTDADLPTAAQLIENGALEYIPFPNDLRGKYQSFTQANLSALRAGGYTAPFLDVLAGLKRYYPWLSSHA